MNLLLIEIILYMIIFAFGSAIFSFLNVVIYRLPLRRSFVKGYSSCTSCGHRLYGRDMIPVLSWCFLRGRCRYCGAKVSARYSLVELMGGIFACLSVIRFGYTPAAATVFGFLGVLTVVAMIDFDTMEIPDRLHVGILILGIIGIWTMGYISPVSRLIGFFSVSVPMLLITMVIAGGFGGGDIKLLAASGFFLGWKLNVLAALLGILFGGLYGMVLLAGRKAGRKDHFAFGPFLCLGMMISLFWGEKLIGWYLGFFPGM